MNSRTLLIWLALAAAPTAAKDSTGEKQRSLQEKIAKRNLQISIDSLESLPAGDMSAVVEILNQVAPLSPLVGQFVDAMENQVAQAVADTGRIDTSRKEPNDGEDDGEDGPPGRQPGSRRQLQEEVPDGCMKPTPAPAPVCKDEDGKGGKGGKKGRGDDDDGGSSGKGSSGRGKKGSSSSSGKGSGKGSAPSKKDGITHLDVMCNTQLVLEGNEPCVPGGLLTPVFIDPHAATVVPTMDIVCSGDNPNTENVPFGPLGSGLAVCDGVTLDGHGRSITSTDGRIGSLVFLGPGSSLTDTTVSGFSVGILAIADSTGSPFGDGPVSITDTVVDENFIGMIALNFASEITMSNVDITESDLIGMILISLAFGDDRSAVTMHDVSVTGSEFVGILSVLFNTDWTANGLNTSNNGSTGIIIFPLFENVITWEHVTSNGNEEGFFDETGSGLLIVDFFSRDGDVYTISDSEFSGNGFDGITAFLRHADITLDNVQANGNDVDGVFIEADPRGDATVTASLTDVQVNSNGEDGLYFESEAMEGVSLTLEHVEAIANGEDGLDLEVASQRSGPGDSSFDTAAISVSNVFSCANADDDFEIDTGYIFSRWADTTCDDIDFDGRSQDYLACENECPAACMTGM